MLKIAKNYIGELEIFLGVKKTQAIHEKKLWKKAKKYQKIFSYLPGIRAICVCNSLAMNSAHKASDIDLFIITKKNRLWTARICITLLLILLGQKKTQKKHTGKFCLSFFITENALSLENIAIKNDIYLAYWLQTLVPIVNKNQVFERFQIANSQLLSYTIPLSILSYQERGDHNNHIGAIPSPVRRGLGRGVLGDTFESLLKKIFLPRTKKSFQKLGKPFGVIISDNMLKFHDKDRRKEIRDAIISEKPQLSP